MTSSEVRGGVALLARPEDSASQILAVDLTVRPQGPHRTVVLPLSVPRDHADRVQWLPSPDPTLFTRLEALFHPLIRDANDEASPRASAPTPRTPVRASVEGGIAVGREGLVDAGLTGNTGQISPDAVCVWARVIPPPRPLWVRWLGLSWGWPKATLAVRLPRPGTKHLVFPTTGLAHWPEAFNPGPTLYVQAPRPPGPVWVDPEQAPGHPFDWREEERSGPRPMPLHPEWPIFRAFSRARAATHDVVVELLERGERPATSRD